MTQQLPHADRTRQLLNVALRLAAADGWNSLTRDGIARAAGVSYALVTHRLGTMDAVRRSVMRLAVKERCVCVVAQGLAARDRQAVKADAELRAAAAAWVGQA